MQAHEDKRCVEWHCGCKDTMFPDNKPDEYCPTHGEKIIKNQVMPVPKNKRSMVMAIINNMPFIWSAFFESATACLFETSRKTELCWMNVKAFPVDFARN